MSLYQFIERIEANNYRAMDFQTCSCMGNIPQLEDAIAVRLETPKQISMFEAMPS